MYVACCSCQVGTSGSPKFDISILYVYTSVQDCVLDLQELQNWGASYTKS